MQITYILRHTTVFSDHNPQVLECISVPVLNGLTTEYTYFEYHGGSSAVYNLHASSNRTNDVPGYSSSICWAV